METSLVISSSEGINIPMESTLGPEHLLHKDNNMEVDGGQLQAAEVVQAQTTERGIDHGKTLTWEDVAAEIASTEEPHPTAEKDVIMHMDGHNVVEEQHYAQPMEESVVPADVSDFTEYVEEKVDSNPSSEHVVQECIVESNDQVVMEEMVTSEHVTDYAEPDAANPCDSINGGDEVKTEGPESSIQEATAAGNHDVVYQQVHEGLEVVHASEVIQETEVIEETEVHATEVHETDVHETEVHETEFGNSEVVHVTEVAHDTEVHETEVAHEAEVHLEAEVAHETEIVHETAVGNTELVHETEVDNTEVIHDIKNIDVPLPPEQQLAEYMIDENDQHTSEDPINNSIESVDSSQNQGDEEEEVEEAAHVYMEEVYVLPNDDVVENVQEVAILEKPKKQRGRKPTSDIPLHVLGREINKPGVTSTNGGRNMPKPRLGVKVPYRNLTSQIVSKEDIQKEIMDRYKLKQEQNVSPTGDIFFARKLTHRLAKKLTPSDGKNAAEENQSTSSKNNAGEKGKGDVNKQPEVVSIVRITRPEQKVDTGLIKDNSDLLAILEGDGDDLQDPSDPNAKTYAEKEKKTENFVKDIEKEIALQQLKELPLTKNKIYKSKTVQENVVQRVENAPAPPTPTPKQKTTESVKQQPSEKKKVDHDPPLKTGIVVKTYTRKRKSMEPEPDYVPSKKSLLAAAAVTNEVELNDDNTPRYITKSSRVIKRKVIWDPAEVASPRTSFKSLKLSSQKVASPLASVAKPSPSPKVAKNNATPKTKVVVVEKKAEEQKKVGSEKVAEKKIDDKKTAEKIIDDKKVAVKKIDDKKATEKKVDDKKPAEKKVDDKKVAEKKVDDKRATEKKVTEKKSPEKKVEEKKAPLVEKTTSTTSPVMKRPVASPTKGTPVPRNKKRLTEIDKLLMDEGAVNMLYDVNNTDTPDKLKKKNKSVISLDREHRVLMSKANMLKNELQQTSNETSTPTKSLRKKVDMTPSPKEPVVPTNIAKRKQSKDSIGSKSSPPMSPASFAPAEASRIIRRHSSSSFSSSDELEEEEIATAEEPKKRLGRPPKVAKKTVVESKKDASAKSTAAAAPAESSAKETTSDKAYTQYKNFNVGKTNKIVSIKFNSAVANNFLTEQIMKEFGSCLNELSKDDDCHVVLVTSNDSSVFCQGIDYKTLVVKAEDARKKKAFELSKCVKNFMRCLLNFPKVLVAGIEGACVGLSVTMLPLFDMVVVNDTATFYTPYASLGCVPEAGFLLTVPHLSSHGLASELLYTSQVLKADDAFRRGLVTRLCWPEKYQEELNSICSDIACQSKQSLVATKSQLRQHIMQSTEASLKSVTSLLIEHWTSVECQKKFDNYKMEVE